MPKLRSFTVGRIRRSLIVQSGRGSQFASAAYRQILAQRGLIAFISRQGNCYDNAFIESFWSSLKCEVVYHQRFASFAEARHAIFHYIETFYNRTRLHSSLAYRSRIVFESQPSPNPTNGSLTAVRRPRITPPQTQPITRFRPLAFG
jgi:transposase InsO family protein